MKKYLVLILLVGLFFNQNLFAQCMFIQITPSSIILDCNQNSISIHEELVLTQACDNLMGESLAQVQKRIKLYSNKGEVIDLNPNFIQVFPISISSNVSNTIGLAGGIDLKNLKFSDSTQKISRLEIHLLNIPLSSGSTTSGFAILDNLPYSCGLEGAIEIEENEQTNVFVAEVQGSKAKYNWVTTPSATYSIGANTNSLIASWDSVGEKIAELTITNGICETKLSKRINVKPLQTGIEDENFRKISFNNPIKNKELVLSKIVNDISISTINGIILLSAKNSDKLAVNLPNGLYLITLDGVTQKLIVE